MNIQLRPAEAARRLGIARSTFWKWAKEDPDFPRLIRIGRTTSVSSIDLDGYISKKMGCGKNGS